MKKLRDGLKQSLAEVEVSTTTLCTTMLSQELEIDARLSNFGIKSFMFLDVARLTFLHFKLHSILLL